MKRYFALLTAFILVLALLTGCTGTDDGNVSNSGNGTVNGGATASTSSPIPMESDSGTARETSDLPFDSSEASTGSDAASGARGRSAEHRTGGMNITDDASGYGGARY